MARIRRDDALFLALLALLATALEYRFGLGNQTEQLPLVMHALDPSLLTNDFYVRSAGGFGPRFYYVELVAGLARWLPLPAVMLGLTLLVNGALAFVTFGAARGLLGSDRLGGQRAATLALCAEGFVLGLVTDIRFQDLQPGSLAIPFCLASLWAGLAGRPLRAAALAALGSLPHPLYGVETGALALCSAACAAWLRAPEGRPPWQHLRALLPVAGGGALLGAATLVFWGLPWLGANPERLPTGEFVSVLAFRSPHHYLPSRFPPAHYALCAAFLGAALIAAWHWRRRGATRAQLYAFACAPLLVLLLCVGGWLFVEVRPTRAAITAQPFRLLYLLKWQGWLLLGWLLAGWIREARLPRAGFGWVALSGSGAAQPPVALGALLAERIDTALRRAWPELPRWLLPALAGLAALALTLGFGKPRELLALAAALPAAWLLSGAPDTRRRALAAALVIGLVAFTAANRWLEIGGWDALRPVASFADQRGPDADVARWAARHTPRDAVFHVPPGMGSFRLVAERAVVVDWKALPFPDAALREWRARMRDLYGDVEGGGFAALARMEEHHRRVSDAQLDEISRRYGARYAVLYSETPTRRRALYDNGRYKIVEL